jgi:hypothetical protein
VIIVSSLFAKAYHSEIYDGNQLGVIDCPGDKLNDDLYCLYPVTIRPQPEAPKADAAADVVTEE